MPTHNYLRGIDCEIRSQRSDKRKKHMKVYLCNNKVKETLKADKVH